MKFSQSVYLVLILIIFNSCSIEKRVHQSGYYISFKKSKLTNSITKLGEVNSNTQHVDSVDNVVEENSTSELVINQESALVVEQGEDNIEDNFLPPISDKIVEIKTFDKEVNELSSRSSENKIIAKPANTNDVNSKGISMIVVGLLLLGLALIFYNLLGVLGLIFAIIFGIGGGIYFLAGLVVLIFNL